MMNYMRLPNGCSKALTLSCGDGVQQDIRLMDILNKHGIKCTFNISISFLQDEERTMPKDR